MSITTHYAKEISNEITSVETSAKILKQILNHMSEDTDKPHLKQAIELIINNNTAVNTDTWGIHSFSHGIRFHIHIQNYIGDGLECIDIEIRSQDEVIKKASYMNEFGEGKEYTTYNDTIDSCIIKKKRYSID